jgi:hypothetical protein
VGPDGPSSLAISPRGEFTRVFWSPRGQLRAGLEGSWTGYADEKDLSRFNGGARLEGTYRSSPSTSWRGNASYMLGHTDSSRVLSSQGVLLPLAKALTLDAEAGLVQGVGRRMSIRVDGRILRTDFVDAPELIDGQSLRGSLGLEYRPGPRTTTALVYSIEDVLTDTSGVGRSYMSHFGSIQWTRILTPRTGLLLEAGASYTPDGLLVGLDQTESFFGGITLTRQVKRAALLAFVRREITPAFGLGVSRLETRFGLSAGIPMGRRWELSVSGQHARPDSAPEGVPPYEPTDDVRAALACRVSDRFEVSAESRYRRRGARGDGAAIGAIQAGLFMTMRSRSGPRVIGSAVGR